MSPQDLLLELHTEELPPKALTTLGTALKQELERQLQKANLSFGAATVYATPRRLAVLIKKVAALQAAQTSERKGPALTAAYDKEGKPTPACLGFARSCGVEVSALITIKNPGGEWVGFQETLPGKPTVALLPAMVQQSLAQLPIAKRMRWGANTETFIRPVHSVILLFGKEVVAATIMGHKTDRFTVGHRFHHPKPIKITSPSKYADILEKKAYVVADFAKRKQFIRERAEAAVQLALGKEANIQFDPALLDEVTGLVEWPIAIVGHFDPKFLSLPAPALISAMQDHQRYFPIVDQAQQLMPCFAAITNIESKDINGVIAGNERVLRARLSDAAFFYQKDKQQKLEARVDALKGIVFQAKLGTLYDKTQRLVKLVEAVSFFEEGESGEISARAALLAKTDLVTEMVGEFPELQGVMGYYYALNDQEPTTVAQAIVEHYKPRYSGDTLPATPAGCMLALVDRIDTLVGVFGINQIPTGDKDPFGLRRAALGVLRILIEKQIDLDLEDLLNSAAGNYPGLENKETVSQLLRFMLERLKAWYQEQGITPDVFAAVAALNLTRPYDMHRRIQAVQYFKGLPDAESLAMANKRVSNILGQYTDNIVAKNIDPALFEDEAEHELARSLAEQNKRIAPLYAAGNYVEVLTQLATLRGPIDHFFERVLVMSEDQRKRENRLLMLSQLRALFLQVADIALLIGK